MVETLSSQLLKQARHLATVDPRRPQQANLRRAVSGAYYALFHFLVDQATRFLIGGSRDRQGLRQVVGRAFTHSELGSVSRTFSGGSLPTSIVAKLGTSQVPAALKEVAQTVREAQAQRHLADYDVGETFLRDEVLMLIDRVEQSIAEWQTIRNDPLARFFLVSLLVWERIRGR